MPYKIAIIKGRYYSTGYGDDEYAMIANSITDWTEVSDTDFKSLKAASTSMDFTVLEQPIDVPAFVAKTVADYTKMVKAAESAAVAEKKKRDEAALVRKLKREQKAQESKLAMLQRLQAELGLETAPLQQQIHNALVR